MTTLRDKIALICGECFKNEIDDVQAAARILAIIHGGANPVAWQYQDGWGNWHSTDFPFSPEKVQNDPHIRPLFIAPPPPTVTREQRQEMIDAVAGAPHNFTPMAIVDAVINAAGFKAESEGE